jgi:hypothetical protein
MSGAANVVWVQEERGVFRLALGAWLGLFAGVIAIVFPVVAIFLSAYETGGFFSFGTSLLQTSGALILAGAVLFILSLLFYRRGFAALRRVDEDFSLASFLCILGSVGFLLILVSASILTSSSSSVVHCINGQPSRALSCLQSGQPLGAYTGLSGFVLAWLGGLGIVYGLWLAGDRFGERPISLGAIFYLIFLFLWFIPLVVLTVPLPEVALLVLVVPILTMAAPLMVLVGTVPQVRARASAG